MEKRLKNIVDLLDNAVLKYAKRTALIFGSKKITYSQLDEISRKFSSVLESLEVKKGDRVSLWLGNCPEYVYSFFGALRIGAIVVPVNTMFRREEAKHIISDAGVKILICSADKLTNSQNILSRLESLKDLICVSAPRDESNVIDFNTLMRASEKYQGDVKSCNDDIAEIVYTSGTTGKPKGACLTHNNLLANIGDCSKAIKVSHKDCIICLLPLFHSFSSTVCMLFPISKGARILIMRSVTPFKRVIRLIFKHRVSIFVGVPSLYNILTNTKISHFKLFINSILNPLKVCICGAATLPLKVCQDFEKKFKRPLLQGYGLTEASPVVSIGSLIGKRKLNSVGKPLASVFLKVVDKDLKDLGLEKTGELLVKGPNVMKGYYNLEEETKKVLKDGWLHTGDLAKIDKDGFVYIVGRLTEMINVRGFNVYPSEIEEVLYKNHYVKEAAVVGVFHRHKGEVPVAFIVGKGKFDGKKITDYLKANLASYKIPIRIFFRQHLPKNQTGKILKRELQREVEGVFK